VKDRAEGGGVNGLKKQNRKCEDRARGIDGLKNQSGKCEGPGKGGRWVKEPESKM
jgi:hypothetical protein